MRQRAFHFFYPTVVLTEEEKARAEMMVLGVNMGLVGTALALVVFLAQGNTEAAFLAIPGVVSCLLCLSVLRWTRSLNAANHVLSLSLVLACCNTALITRDLSTVAWMGLIPMTALLHSSIRQSLIWILISTVGILGVGLWLLEEPASLAVVPLRVLLARLMLFIAAGFGLTLAFAAGRRRNEASLLAARADADRANRAKSEFLASFSHEIRTPLNGVMGTAEAMLASKFAPEVHEQVLIIQRSGSSLLRTINDVLELSRIEAGRLELFPVTTDLPGLLGEVLDLFRARANSRGLELRLEVPATRTSVKVDDLRLRQVVQNLVGNAVKFTERGFVRVVLETSQADGGQVFTRITVEDTGPGIEFEASTRLFAAFTQARPRTDRAAGSGLGLAVSKQFVDLMNGTLRFSPRPGGGSTFTIELTLPAGEDRAAPSVLVPRSDPVRRLKVLVVDDNEINLKVEVALLNRLGHETVVAHDGIQALRAVEEHQPDVIFMDRHMPGMDGLEATVKLREAGDRRPVIAVTASVYSEDQKRCLEAGMNGFISKPVSLQSLETALREVMAQVPVEAVGGDRRVLVVDDDPHVRRTTVRMLRAEGFEVLDAGDVETAMVLFERAPPACLLVDQVLAGAEDGLHFAERLATVRRGLRVVVTSGFPPSSEQLARLTATGGHFLPKPYDRRQLIDSVSTGAQPALRAG
ncbi:MAG: response regulator [Myxococcales bacterium]|nr:response regulator [Myxococcales bacterium]